MTTSPQIQTGVIFDAAALGYLQMRIPALVRTTRGTLLAFCEARRAGNDWAEIDIILRRSEDGGTSWSAMEVLVPSSGGPSSNSLPIVDRDGTVHFLFHRDYARCYYIRSVDDGVTWSEPRDITAAFEAFRPEYPWKVLAPGPGHGIQLRTGRLVVPLWLCAPDPSGEGGDHRPSCVTTIHSDDGGETWQRGEIVVDNGAEFVNPSETAAVELSDGRVMLNIRSETARHRRIVSVSADGATGWSPAVFDEALYEPVCMAGLLSMTDPRTGKFVLLFCNPDSHYDPQDYNKVGFRRRENGTIRASYDDGRTWTAWRTVEAGPFSYCDLAAAPDGTIFCLYEAGLWGKVPHHLNTHVALACFSLEWIENRPGA